MGGGEGGNLVIVSWMTKNCTLPFKEGALLGML